MQSIFPPLYPRILVIGALLAVLTACASHKAPDCKGPYTPIESTREASHGA
jgi:hypothetical protein